MRDIKVIEADIAKLQAELADAQDHKTMRDAAVHILKNLGWTYDRGWQKPKDDYKVFDQNTMTHIKARDWVKYDTGVVGGYAFVRSVHGAYARISMVRLVTPMGARVEERDRMVHCAQLKVVSHEEIMKNFK